MYEIKYFLIGNLMTWHYGKIVKYNLNQIMTWRLGQTVMWYLKDTTKNWTYSGVCETPL